MTVGRSDIEDALERGFGLLMAMEASLQPGIADAHWPDLDRRRLVDCIERLRQLLTELRLLASPEGQSKIGYGFVLPTCRRDGGDAIGLRQAG